MGFQRVRQTRGQMAILGQHPGRQGEDGPEVRGPRPDLTHPRYRYMSWHFTTPRSPSMTWRGSLRHSVTSQIPR